MKAWEFLSKEGSWTQGSFAREADGSPCLIESHEATCFCILGALRRCYPDMVLRISIETTIDHVVQERKYGNGIVNWNDQPGRHREEVVALLKELDV